MFRVFYYFRQGKVELPFGQVCLRGPGRGRYGGGRGGVLPDAARKHPAHASPRGGQVVAVRTTFHVSQATPSLCHPALTLLPTHLTNEFHCHKFKSIVKSLLELETLTCLDSFSFSQLPCVLLNIIP